jgi:hypothetical protein
VTSNTMYDKKMFIEEEEEEEEEKCRQGVCIVC